MRTILTLFVGIVAGAIVMQSVSPSTQAASPSDKVLRHIVLYKFKDGLPESEVQKVIDAFAGLPQQVDTIIGFEHGPNVSTEGKSEGMTYGFQVTFANEAGLATYLKHPAHDAYVQVVKDRREKVLVFDYWAPAK